MKIITAAVVKGGTAKTTTCAALAQAAAVDGKRVLAIDLDPQGNLSYALGAGNGYTSLELLEGMPPGETIQTVNGIDIIPARAALQTIESYTGSANRLQNALATFKYRYDMIIIDTPPTGGELQYNALQACTNLIIPLLSDVFSLQGLYHITDMARQFQKSNPAMTINGALITRYDPKSIIVRQLKEAIERECANQNVPFLGVIREAVAAKEAQTLQKNLFEYAPKSKPAQDYMELYRTIAGGE